MSTKAARCHRLRTSLYVCCLQDMSREINDTMSRSYDVPEDLDESDLMAELEGLEGDMTFEGEAEAPSYLQVRAPLGHQGVPHGAERGGGEHTGSAPACTWGDGGHAGLGGLFKAPQEAWGGGEGGVGAIRMYAGDAAAWSRMHSGRAVLSGCVLHVRKGRCWPLMPLAQEAVPHPRDPRPNGGAGHACPAPLVPPGVLPTVVVSTKSASTFTGCSTRTPLVCVCVCVCVRVGFSQKIEGACRAVNPLVGC